MNNINIIKSDITNGKIDDILMSLYGEKEESRKRYLYILERFSDFFGNEREIEIFSAPGRTEIIGNHTDHQNGKAIAASVNLDIVAVASLNGEKVIRIYSEGYSEMDEINIESLDIKPEETGHSKALIRGCAEKFSKLGYNVDGFDIYTHSNVLKGSGLSSSAAFEVLIATVINNLFCEGREDAVSIAKTGKYAENVYFGKPCGMLDQTASSVGGFVYMDFEDNNNPYIEKVDFDLKKYGYSLCVVNTGGSHAGLTDEYASVSNDMKSVCSYFGKNVLRELSEEEFYENIDKLRKTTSERSIIRAGHFFDEMRRVVDFKKALHNDDFESIIKLVSSSGNSSYKYLQNVFSISDIENQALSLALYVSERILKDKGVVRVHGGGFAGTIQAYVPNDMIETYINEIEKVFGKGRCYKLFIRKHGGIKVI